MDSMNFNYLKAFYAVAKHKSFTLAGKELNISQPTISIHVQKLEKYCLNPLLIRKGKYVELTQEGHSILSYAEKIFALTDEMERTVRNVRNPSLGKLKIGVTFLTVKDLAPKIIRNLKNEYPDIEIQLFTGTTDEILENVINYEYHLGIVARTFYPDNLVYKHIQKEKLYFITADSKMKGKIHLEDLSNYPIILPVKGVVYREIIINEFVTRNIPLNIYAEVMDPITIKSMVQKGLGGAFISLNAIKQDAQDRKFRIIDILDDLHFNFDIIYLKERKSSKTVRSIISAIKCLFQ